jgi:hypothetical protein
MADLPDELSNIRRQLSLLIEQANHLAHRVKAMEDDAARTSHEAAAPVVDPDAEAIEEKSFMASAEKSAARAEKPSERAVVTPPPLPPTEIPQPKPVAKPARKPVAAPPRREINWEMWLGTYGLLRVGAVVTVTAVALLLSLGMERWGAPFRVSVGYGVALVLMGLGVWTEKKYTAYGRALLGVGFALVYFVTYAAHYVAYSHVIESEGLTWFFLALVVAAWAATAQLMRSRIMALFATVLAHYTIFLTGPWSTSVVAIAMLSVGSAFFLLKNRWYYVAAVGLVGSYVNHLLWAIHNDSAGQPVDFALSMTFLVTYFLVFALAELFSHEDVRRREVPTWFRSGLVSVNTVSFLALGSLTVDAFAFTKDHQDALYLITALPLLLLGYGYLRLRKGDPLYNAYITKAVAVATIGLALRYSDEVLTTVLAIECAVLLMSARRSGLIVTRLLAYGALCLTMVQWLGALSTTGPPVVYGTPAHLGELAQAVLATLALLVATYIAEHTDWAARSPKTLPVDENTKRFLWRLGFLSEAPSGEGDVTVNRRIIPHVYGSCAALFTVGSVLTLFQPAHKLTVLALAALVLGVAAMVTVTRSVGLGSVAIVLVSLIVATATMLAENYVVPSYAVLAAILLMATAFLSEKRYLHGHGGLMWHQAPDVSVFLYGVAAWCASLALFREFAPSQGAVAMAGLTIVAMLLAKVLDVRAMAGAWSVFMVSALFFWLRDGSPSEEIWWNTALWSVVTMAFIGDRFFVGFLEQKPLRPLFSAALVAVWIAFCGPYVGEVADAMWWALWWTIAAAVLLAYGLAFRCRTGAILSIITALGAALLVVLHSLVEDMTLSAIYACYIALVTYWVIVERLAAWAAKRYNVEWQRNCAAIPVAIVTALGLFWFGAIPDLATTYLAVMWTIVALALFGLALLFKQKLYRYGGLVVLAFAFGRVAINIVLSDIDTIYKVAAAFVLGAVMLGISFGYFKAREKATSGQEPPSLPPSDEP